MAVAGDGGHLDVEDRLVQALDHRREGLPRHVIPDDALRGRRPRLVTNRKGAPMARSSRLPS